MGQVTSAAGFTPAFLRNNILLPFGDSLTLRCGPRNTTQGIAYAVGDSTNSGDLIAFPNDGYLTYANALLNGRFMIPYCPAVSGYTSAQMLALIPSMMAAYRPGVATILIGINDVQAGTPASTTIANVQSACKIIRDFGALPVLFTIPPINVGYAGMTQAKKNIYYDINTAYREMCRSGAAYLGGDLAAVTTDPDTGDWLASGSYGMESNLSSDNLHQAPYGAAIMGYEVFRRLQSIFPSNEGSNFVGGTTNAQGVAFDATTGTCTRGNLIRYGQTLGTGGTITTLTGSLATGWSEVSVTVPTAGSVAAAKVARNATAGDPTTFVGPGSWQQITMTTGTGNGTVQLRIEATERDTNADGVSDNAAWSVGDKIYGQMNFQTDSTGWAGNSATGGQITLEVECWNTSSVLRAQCFQTSTPDNFFRMPSGKLRTPVIRIPSGTTRLYLWVYFRGQGIIRFSDVELRKWVGAWPPSPP